MATESDPIPPKDCACGALWTVRGKHGKPDCPFKPPKSVELESDPIEQAILDIADTAAGLAACNYYTYEELKKAESFQEALTAIRQEVERICLEVIGTSYSMKGYSRSGGKGYAIKFANDTKDVERQRLAAALRGLEGK